MARNDALTISKRAIWWRSENREACQSLSFGRVFDIAFFALIPIPVLAFVTLELAVMIMNVIGAQDFASFSILETFTLMLGFLILFLCINLPIITFYCVTVFRGCWIGILPTLAGGIVYGCFWVQMMQGQGGAPIEFTIVVLMLGMLHAFFIWLATRLLMPQLFQDPPAEMGS